MARIIDNPKQIYIFLGYNETLTAVNGTLQSETVQESTRMDSTASGESWLPQRNNST